MRRIANNQTALFIIAGFSVITSIMALVQGKQDTAIIQLIWVAIIGLRLWYLSQNPEINDYSEPAPLESAAEKDPRKSYDFTDKWQA